MHHGEGLVSVLLHLAPVQTSVMDSNLGDGQVSPDQRHPRVPPDFDAPRGQDSVSFLPEHDSARPLAQLGHGAVQVEAAADLDLPAVCEEEIYMCLLP